MIGYVTVGTDDIDLATRFYSAILPRLVYRLEASAEGMSDVLPGSRDGSFEPPDFHVKHLWDWQPASPGNGAMVAFQVPIQVLVRALHGAGLAAGGRDEGAPGFRADYGAHFYVGYLRDPQGNKLALYCASRGESGRPA